MGLQAVDNLFKQNLAEWVYDEEKLVTYQYLSVALGENVNLAKQMLYQFYVEEKAKDVKGKARKTLHALYHVSGLVKCSDSGILVCTTTICRDDKLDSVKATFDSLSSVHVYAVEASSSDDGNDTDTGCLLKKLSKVFKEVAEMKEGSDVSILGLGPFKSITPILELAKAEIPSIVASVTPEEKVKATDKKPTPSTTKSTKGKTGISLWAKSAIGAKGKSSTTESSSSDNTIKTEVPEKVEVKIKPKLQPVKKPAANAFEGYKDVIDSDTESEEDAHFKSSPPPPSPPSRKMKRKASHSPSPPPRSTETRRRRRIQVLVDSSDEEEQEVEEVKPSLDKNKNYFEPIQNDTPAVKKNKTKLITTQVLDEDGFLVTKREKVSESEPDESETEETKIVEGTNQAEEVNDKLQKKPKNQPAAQPITKFKTQNASSPPKLLKKPVSTKRSSSTKPGSDTGNKSKQSSITSFLVKKT